MRFRGGHNILLQGRPEGTIKVMPEPKILYLPLRSERFSFSEICVEDGQSVSGGDVLTKDPNNYAVPLLAPRAGTVRLKAAENHIVLEDIARLEEHADIVEEEQSHIMQEMGAAGIKRYRLLVLGAWQFFYDAFTGLLPDPLGTPQAIIVSTVSLEPFVASEFANLVRNQIRGYAWVKMLEIPLTYPYDNFAILARRLGLTHNDGPVWAVRAEGVLAVDRALTLEKPCLVRIISIGGTGVNSPTHIKVIPGYPIKKIKDNYVSEPVARMINAGILTGEILGEETLGIDTECRGITVLPELRDREFLGFVRPGWSRHCYAPCYLSALRKKFRERFSTGLRGEARPCVSCGYCDEVCPAGIMPSLIHKYLYRDLIEEADEARINLCVECGLCSYVCPSKIDLRQQLINAKDLIAKEKEEVRQEQLRQEEARKESEEKSE
ncbi:MAG: 4Fe-4S dicluster domain-containing protein [Planctomycetota bacterium]